MLAVGNDELEGPIKAGDMVPCPYCHRPHAVNSHGGKDPGTDVTTSPDLLQTVTCPESGKSYVVGIAGSYLPPKPQASKHYRKDDHAE